MMPMKKKRQEQQNIKVTHDGSLNYAEADSRTAREWRNKTKRWSDLLQMLQDPVETYETPEEYDKMPKNRQGDIKDVGGIVGGWLKNGQRKKGNVQQRSLVILDADFAPQDWPQDIQMLFEHAIAWCTTHSHKKHKPKYRVFIPLSQPITGEQYEPVARKIAETFGMDIFDDTTYQAERLMHKPSHSKGAEYIQGFIDLPWLDPTDILNGFDDWRDASFWPESSRGHAERATQAKRAGEPTEKRGIVGAFCRAYDIIGAIEKFLPEVYAPTSHEDRWTYLDGTTSGGLVIYDSKFAYSHHNTDPVGDKLSNAFDLVRVHMFGDLDDEVKPQTPANRYPSYVAMVEFLQEDRSTKAELVKSQLGSAYADFSDIEEDGPGDEDWTSDLRLSTLGKIEPTIYNTVLILEKDPNLKECLTYNEFADAKERSKKVPWQTKIKKAWTDNDTVLLSAYLDDVYTIQINENRLRAALLKSAMNRPYNPVKEYIEKEPWDGVKRLETYFIDCLGVENTPYARAVTRKWFAGAVARIYNPGCKFEMMPVLSGAQGIGKSTAIRQLAPDYFTDGLNGLGQNKDDLQFLKGSWLIEVSELSAMKRTEAEKTKQFISAQVDRFRWSYGIEVEEHPRTCVFIGTTNDETYLKDKSGNRRYYPLPCNEENRKFTSFGSEIAELVPKLWAEAKYYYDQGEELFLSGELEKVAREKQKEAEAEDLMQNVIYEYLEIAITDNWYTLSQNDRRNYIQGRLEGSEEDLVTSGFGANKYIPRDTVTALEIYIEAFNKPAATTLDGRSNGEVRKIGLVMSGHQGWKRQAVRLPDKKEIVAKGYKRL